MSHTQRHQLFIQALGNTMCARDGELLVSSTVSGDTQIVGYRDINTRAMNTLATKHGVSWSVTLDPDTTSTRPTLRVRNGDEWRAPRPVLATTNDVKTTVNTWATTRPGLRVASNTVTDRSSGSIIRLRYQARGPLSSTDISDIIDLPGVVNVFISVGMFEVWIARTSNITGSLQHLSSTKQLSNRIGPKHRRKATKAFRQRSRRPFANRRRQPK